MTYLHNLYNWKSLDLSLVAFDKQRFGKSPHYDLMPWTEPNTRPGTPELWRTETDKCLSGLDCVDSDLYTCTCAWLDVFWVPSARALCRTRLFLGYCVFYILSINATACWSDFKVNTKMLLEPCFTPLKNRKGKWLKLLSDVWNEGTHSNILDLLRGEINPRSKHSKHRLCWCTSRH